MCVFFYEAFQRLRVDYSRLNVEAPPSVSINLETDRIPEVIKWRKRIKSNWKQKSKALTDAAPELLRHQLPMQWPNQIRSTANVEFRLESRYPSQYFFWTPTVMVPDEANKRGIRVIVDIWLIVKIKYDLPKLNFVSQSRATEETIWDPFNILDWCFLASAFPRRISSGMFTPGGQIATGFVAANCSDDVAGKLRFKKMQKKI